VAIVIERPAATAGEDEAPPARAGKRVDPMRAPGGDTAHSTRHNTAAALLLAVGEYGALASGALCNALLHPLAARRPGLR
jgi:hypothetical protein